MISVINIIFTYIKVTLIHTYNKNKIHRDMLNKDKILLESLVEKYGAKGVEVAISRLHT